MPLSIEARNIYALRRAQKNAHTEFIQFTENLADLVSFDKPPLNPILRVARALKIHREMVKRNVAERAQKIAEHTVNVDLEQRRSTYEQPDGTIIRLGRFQGRRNKAVQALDEMVRKQVAEVERKYR